MVERLQKLIPENEPMTSEKHKALTHIDTYSFSNSSMSKEYMEYICKLFKINSDQLFGLKPIFYKDDVLYRPNVDKMYLIVHETAEMFYLQSEFPPDNSYTQTTDIPKEWVYRDCIKIGQL